MFLLPQRVELFCCHIWFVGLILVDLLSAHAFGWCNLFSADCGRIRERPEVRFCPKKSNYSCWRGSVNTAAGPSHSFGYSYQCFNGFGQPAPFLLLQIMALVPICQSVLPRINRILNETGS